MTADMLSRGRRNDDSVIAGIIFFKFSVTREEASRRSIAAGAQEYCITPSLTLPKRKVTMSNA
jgi:hypothetical protein